MKITVEIPARNVQRLNLKIGDGMEVNNSKRPHNRFYGTIINLEYEKDEKEFDKGSGGGSFNAG